MDTNEMNEELNKEANTPARQPKPLRKLARIDKKPASENGEYIPKHEAVPYQPKHEVPSHEAPSHEAHPELNVFNPDNAEENNEGQQFVEASIYDEEFDGKEIYNENFMPKKVAEEKSKTDILVKIGSIVLSFVLILALVLNMPILRYKKAGQPDERVSIVTYFKRWQPLVDIEGELQKPSQDFGINTDIVNDDYTDGLDLPQLIEGQYTILFLGFDEDEYLTDVVWVCQFDIAAAKLNILQIPRDTAVPDYTSNPTCKFNSVYSWGDQSVTPIQRVVNAVQENFGIPIDAYITTACFDIVDMVDLIGGIPITLDNEIVYECDKIIPAGDIVLNGNQAEWFVRFRHDWLQGDLGRVQNQRRFMAAAMNKLFRIVKDEGRMQLYSYLNTIYKNQWIATNMSVEDLSKVADFASILSMENVSVNMVPGEAADYIDSMGNKVSFYSVHKQATIDILNAYFRPYQNVMTSSDTALVEYVTNYKYLGFDDTNVSLDEMEHATEPLRAN